MARKLTRKERGFVKDIVRGETGTQAALNNYDTDNYNIAASIASENLSKPKIINAIEERLPDELLGKIHLEGLFATKGIYRQTDEYTWVKIDEEPDYNTIHKYLDSAYKIKGKYKDVANNTNILVQISETLAKKYDIDRSPEQNSR